MCGNSRTAIDTPSSQLSLAYKAIDFAAEKLEPWEVQEFLADFRKNHFSAWPDFIEYAGGFTLKDVAK